jgi:DNA-binding MarR family transcriptional regulator
MRVGDGWKIVTGPPLSGHRQERRALRLARRIYAFRRRRDRLLADFEFFDPSWDLILDLFIAAEEGRRVALSSAWIAAAVPKTTAQRTIERLVSQGHLSLEPDMHDRRRAYVHLSPVLHERIRRFLINALDIQRP